MDFKAERVKQLNCGKCGAEIDPSGPKPLSTIECPACHHQFTVPASFGDFLLTAVIGTGAAGIVCRAFDENLHRQVAMKILRADAESSALTQACQSEARALAALNHPNVVQVHSIGEYRGQPYIVMELLDGGSVEKKMLTDKADETACLDLAIHVAEGLEAARQVGLVHMDVKPANILYDRHGNAKLIDFGVARIARKSSDEIAGTPYYVAPEVVRGKPADQQADIYSLGATLFHLLAHRPPFAGSKATAVISARLKAPAPPLTDFRSDLHDRTIAVVARMLEADPADRYANYDDLLVDLRAARAAANIPLERQQLHELSTVSSPRSRSKSTAQKNAPLIMTSAIIAVLLIIAIVIGVIAFKQSQPVSRSSVSSTRPSNDAADREEVRLPHVPEPGERPAPTTTTTTPEPATPVALAPNKPEPMPEPAPKPEPAPAPTTPAPVKPEPAPTTGQPANANKSTFEPLDDKVANETIDGQWHVLDIREAINASGADMTRLEDGSVLVSGRGADTDTYTFVTRASHFPIRQLCIQALPHPSLKKEGPGRSGNFALTHVAFFISDEKTPDKLTLITLANPIADFEQTNTTVKHLLEPNNKVFWSIADQFGKAHQVTFTVPTPIQKREGALLTVRLAFHQPRWLTMGRVRLLVSSAEPSAELATLTPPKAMTKPTEPAPKPTEPPPPPASPALSEYVVLKPTNQSSAEKSQMSVQDDGSILVDSKKVAGDTYTVTCETDIPAVTGVRIELLPDASLRDGGPGAAAGGVFALAEFGVTIAPKDDPTKTQPLKLAQPTADMDEEKYAIANAIDGDPKTFWSVKDHPGEARTASFAVEPAGSVAPAGSVLTFTIANRFNIGRFRLLATASTDAAVINTKPAEPAPAGATAQKPEGEKPADKPMKADNKNAKPEPAATAASVHLQFNLGGPVVTIHNTEWPPAPAFNGDNAGYLGGNPSINEKVGGGNALINSAVSGITGFKAKVPNGRYLVTMIFLELDETPTPGERVFSISFQGMPPAGEFQRVDPAMLNQKSRGPSRLTAGVVVNDGVLDLTFKPADGVKKGAILNAIAIEGR
ncbi:MAG: protein kinase [Planctomycetes bacterium]|nr:protein kinase [Planctomycetota bacterium]